MPSPQLTITSRGTHISVVTENSTVIKNVHYTDVSWEQRSASDVDPETLVVHIKWKGRYESFYCRFDQKGETIICSIDGGDAYYIGQAVDYLVGLMSNCKNS